MGIVAVYGRRAMVVTGEQILRVEALYSLESLMMSCRVGKESLKGVGTDIAGVDIIYDLEREEYVVLEVNGIPAFATPEQERLGLDFNNKKIDLIVDLIDRRTKKRLKKAKKSKKGKKDGIKK